MTDRDFFTDHATRGDYVVPAPRLGDAIGQALKGAYATSALPADMRRLLGQLDRVMH